MDSYVQVALIEKSKKVFTTDAGAFLSFPLLSPLTFKPRELASLSTPASAQDYAAAANFARIVNILPRDMVASAGDGRCLWDIYGDVLTRADIADGAGGQNEQDNSAAAILYEVAPDGTRSESAQARAYRQYRDAWFVARENYGAQKLTGELSDDPLVRKNWVEIEEPVLRAAMDQAAADWTTLGFRAAIEAAREAERAAAVNNPRVRWQEWVSDFNPDIDLLTETGGARYAPTGLSPKDFTADSAWLHFNLSSAEIASLVRDAPAALKVVLDQGTASTIDHVSFDYRSVGLVRPWYRSEVFGSGIWRSSDPNLALSDGGDPAAGVCPAYVTAVVFVRNLQVVSRGGTAPTANQAALHFTLAADRLTARAIAKEAVLQRPAVLPSVAAPTTAQLQAFRRLDSQSLTLVQTPALQSMALRSAARPSVEMQMDPDLRPRLPITRIPIRPRPIPIMPPATPTPDPPAPSDEISILAFICKRLPKAPDPQPGLNWD